MIKNYLLTPSEKWENNHALSPGVLWGGHQSSQLNSSKSFVLCIIIMYEQTSNWAVPVLLPLTFIRLISFSLSLYRSTPVSLNAKYCTHLVAYLHYERKQ